MNVYPEIMDKVQFELSPKPSKQQKAAQGKSAINRADVEYEKNQKIDATHSAVQKG